jgi:hypothetical protein
MKSPNQIGASNGSGLSQPMLHTAFALHGLRQASAVADLLRSAEGKTREAIATH